MNKRHSKSETNIPKDDLKYFQKKISNINNIRNNKKHIEFFLGLNDDHDFEDSYTEFDDWDPVTDYWTYEHDTIFSKFKERYNINNENDLEELLDFFYSYELSSILFADDIKTLKNYKIFKRKMMKSYSFLWNKETELSDLHNNTFNDDYFNQTLYNKLVKRPLISYINKFIEFFELIEAFYSLRHSLCLKMIERLEQKDKNKIVKRKLRKWNKSLAELSDVNFALETVFSNAISDNKSLKLFDKTKDDLINELNKIHKIELNYKLLEEYLLIREEHFIESNIDGVFILDGLIKSIETDILNYEPSSLFSITHKLFFDKHV